jgi:uncharacterized protein
VRLCEDIVSYCTTIPAIRAAVLFGSAATNRLHAESDVDLAFLFGFGNIPTNEMLEYMQGELEQIARRDVDLIVLDSAPTILAFQIIKTGSLIYCPDQRLYDTYVMRLISEYADFKITRRPIEAAIMARRVL